MTRKDFQIIAEVISQITNWNARRTAADLFAVRLAYINPSFDKGRFLEACGCTKYAADLPLLDEPKPIRMRISCEPTNP